MVSRGQLYWWEIDFKKLTSYVENRLLMIIKIVNGNYYDLYNKS